MRNFRQRGLQKGLKVPYIYRGLLALGIKNLNIFGNKGVSKRPKVPNTYRGIFKAGIKKYDIFFRGGDCQKVSNSVNIMRA